MSTMAFSYLISILLYAIKELLWLIGRFLKWLIHSIFRHVIRFVSSIIIYVLYILVFYSISSCLDHGIFPELDYKFKWIRREWRLLQAVLKDVEEVMDSGGHLPEIRTEWLPETKSLVQKSEHYIVTYSKYRKNEYPWRFLSMLKYQETNQIKKKIRNHLEKYKFSVGIYRSPGLSRMKLRSLTIDENESIKPHYRLVTARVYSLLEKLDNLITIKKNIIGDMKEQIESMKLRLELLCAFLTDLEDIELESEMEKAWLEEVLDLIIEAGNAIKTFLETSSKYSLFKYWIPTFMFQDITWISDGIDGLFNGKDRYGFNFIRRKMQAVQHENKILSPDDKVIPSVVEMIRNKLNQEPNASDEVVSQVKSLSNQLEDMQKLFKYVKAIEGVSNSRMAWLEVMEKISCAAVDFIKNLEFSASERRNYLNDTKRLHHIKHAISLLKRSTEVYRIELRLVVGLDEDTHSVVSRLTNSEHFSIISIVGMQGIGKTTLAKNVYNHRAIMKHFSLRAWVSIGQEFDETTLLEDVGNQVLRTHEALKEQKGKEYWIKKINESLKGKMYLLILDNMPTKEAWDTLAAAFQERTQGSRILLTTRYKTVASHADQSSDPYLLRLLTKEESWRLFSHMVPFSSKLPSKHEKLAKLKEVVGRCGGLPLAILHLRDLMSGRGESVTVQELSAVLEQINQYQTPWSESIANQELAEHLKELLSYFTLFPRNFDIPVRRLITLFVAEGLVKECPDKKETPERVAENYLSDLIDLNLIQVAEKKIDGKEKTCCLPSALQEHNFCQSTSTNSRIARHFDNNSESSYDVHGNTNSPGFNVSNKNPTSYLVFDTREGNIPGENIGNSLQRDIASGYFHRLLVLDLERVFRPQLPNNIEKLVELRYLGLRWTYLETIPSSIGKLRSLQILDVKHTYVRTLPSSIWKLRKLRHLYLNQSHRSKFVYQQSGSSLKNLQTLWGLFLDDDSAVKNGLNKLLGLRKLALAFELNFPKQKALAEWVAKLKNLEHLRLRSVDQMGEPQDLYLEPLIGLKNLCRLYLFGSLSIMPEFPQSISDLTLSASRLQSDPMPNLEKLPNLRLLCFYSDSYMGKHMVCNSGGFPQLLVLKCWKLGELQEWDVQEQAMKNLRELELRSCKNLKVPMGLRYLKTLRELKLTNMPDKFTTAIEKNEGPVWDDIAYYPTIIKDNW